MKWPMNILKRWAWILVVGEVIALFSRDKSFKQERDMKDTTIDKLKTLGTHLTKLNQEFVVSMQQHDYQWTLDKLRQEYDEVEEIVHKLYTQAESFTKETATEYITQADEYIAQFRSALGETNVSLQQKISFEEKIDKLKEIVTRIKWFIDNETEKLDESPKDI